jgi:hypothetical protein
MILYLLNASLVWLFSLLAYELLFRRETVHNWNRAYLLTTLALGLLLPLWSWQPQVVVEAPAAAIGTLPTVIDRATSFKTEVVNAVTPQQSSWSFSWWMVYAAGAAIAFLVTLKDAVQLIRLYTKGKRSVHNGWTLVETDKEHSPFSFFNTIFLPAGVSYSEAELDMVLRHERQHGVLLHSLDVLAVQVLRIVLWFHPAVYWYSSRLTEVHEYQADAVAANRDTEVYGRLLLAQATGMVLPPIVHSFHRSPLKNRIAMLVKNPSGAGRLLRYVVTVPLVAGCALFCSRTALAQQVVTKGGNKFTMSPADEVTITTDFKDKTKAETHKITILPEPKKVNGEKIYGWKETTTPAKYTGTFPSAAEQFFSAIQAPMSKLPDGRYVVTVFTPVISPKGEMVYYDTRGVEKPGISPTGMTDAELEAALKARGTIDPEMKKEIDANIDRALKQHYSFKPATVKGKPVTAYLEGDLDLSGRRQIEVKGGVARLVSSSR